MTGRREHETDEEQAIRAWLAESAPDRAPSSLRETLESVTTRRAGNARPDQLLARRAAVLKLLAAAVAVLALVASSVYLYARSASAPSGQGASSGLSWRAVIGGLPALDGSYRPGGPPLYARPSGGFVAFIPGVVPSQTGGMWTTGSEVFTSPDGITWAEQAYLDGYVTSMVSAGSRSVAVGCSVQDGRETASAWTTSDFKSWEGGSLPGLAGSSSCVAGIAAGPNGFLAWTFVPASSGSEAVRLSRFFWSSADGTSWQILNVTGLPADVSVDDLSAIANGYVIRGILGDRAATWYSADGHDWVQAWTGPEPSGGEAYRLGKVFETPAGGYVSFGGAVLPSSEADVLADWLTWTSEDGLHWTLAQRAPAPGWITDIAKGPEGYVAVGSNERKEQDPVVTRLGPPAVWTSTDGRTWQPVGGLPVTAIATAGSYWVASEGAHVVVVCEDVGPESVLLVE
jgi:hypothetical protein